MAEFGLDYEAMDIRRDLYMTDSGGNLRAARDARGSTGRRESTEPSRYGRIVGLLTHPLWWDLQADAPAGRPFRHWQWPLDAEEPVEVEAVAKGRSPLGSLTQAVRSTAARARAR
jgi:hypothetical protein